MSLTYPHAGCCWAKRGGPKSAARLVILEFETWAGFIQNGCMRSILLAAALAFFAGPDAPAADFDVLIRNGRIVDGTATPGSPVDVGIAKGRIVAVGRLGEERGQDHRRQGPRRRAGFIDVHTHIEGAVEKVRAGTTTFWMGDHRRDRQLRRIDGQMGEWFASLEKTGLGLNVASLIGHNSVRRR